MSRILIVAEKPSVATDLARVLGKDKSIGKFTRDKSGAYYENEHMVITSAVGHLLEQRKPTTPEGKSLPWKMEVLPVIPDKFELEPIAKSEDRLKRVLRLARAKDIVEIVNACDAGREGELIFRNLQRYGKWKQPIKRLWMQSMTDKSIMEAWHALRDDAAMQNLAEAAQCRAESDWIVGLNSTRALTVLQSRGGFNMTPAGRVQTPTLAILVQRELEIRDFVSIPYSEVVANFSAQAGEYQGKWIDPEWKKTDDPNNRQERIWRIEEAESIAARCAGKLGDVTEETKPVRQIAPQLYDLTTLQREASNRYGFSARRTLQLAQECYEKHKVLTYPRTDSRYLPEDYIETAKSTMQTIVEQGGVLASFATEALEKNLIKMNRRIFDSSKVSDHFAIIPTGNTANLGGDVLRLYELVLARFIAVFFPAAEFLDTKRLTKIGHKEGLADLFLTTGRVLVTPGWLGIYGRTAGSSKEDLPSIQQHERVSVQEINVIQSQTKPPTRYNEATLLSAMEGAGKMINDEDMREAMRERGLGTPATRAAIIEGLIAQDYIVRDKRDLIVSRRGIELIDLLKTIGLETLTSPALTGEWEYKLKLMEQGGVARGSFMGGIKTLAGEIVEHIKKYRHEQQSVEFEDLAVKCPQCGAMGLRTTMDAYSCRTEGCKFSLRRVISGRSIAESEAIELITQGHTGVLEGFTSRFGKKFDAALQLDEKFRAKFKFDDEPEETQVEELSEEQKIGMISLDKKGEHAVYETEKNWRVPTLISAKNPKGVSISRQILSHKLTRDEVMKLLTEGKTNLIKGFVSQRTKRAFNAFLTFEPKTGNVGFEFEPRAAKSKTTSRKSPATKQAEKDVSETPEMGSDKSLSKVKKVTTKRDDSSKDSEIKQSVNEGKKSSTRSRKKSQSDTVEE